MNMRIRKVRRDLRRQWGRAVLVIIAMALAVLGVTAISTSYYVAKTQQRAGYLATNPPSATIVADGLTPDVVGAVRAVPGVVAADTSRTVSARIRRPGTAEWQTMRLTVRGDYAANAIAQLTPRTGDWPPPPGQIVLERSGLRLLDNIEAGASVQVELPGTPDRILTVAGTNSDPGQPPGWVEDLVYGYVTPDTLAGLGFTAPADELCLLVDGDRFDRTHVTDVTNAVRARLTALGARVRTVEIAEPGHHPHQDIMNGMLRLELLFGALALALSALLIVTAMSGLLAGQTRQIGTLKAIGARTGQVVAGYAAAATLLAGLACLVGWPLGRLAGLGFVGFVAQFMNFDVGDDSMPWWLITAQLAGGLTVPLLVAGGLLWRAARVTAVRAMRHHGVTAPATTGLRARLAGWLSTRTRVPRLPLMAARNAFRRRGRLILAASALALGGATFMAAGNIADGLEDTFVEQTLAAEPYDVSAVLERPHPNSAIDEAVASVNGVARAERWLASTVTSTASDTVTLIGAPLDSPDLRLRVQAGDWITSPGANQIVLSREYTDDHAGIGIGGTITLRFGEQSTTWRVVGVAVQVGGPGAWVAYDDLAAALGATNATNYLRVLTTAHDDASVTQVQRDLETALNQAGATVVTTRTQGDLRQILVAHKIIFAVFLNLMTLLCAVVGAFGVATTMTVAIIERTREIGVLRAVGATNRSLLGLVAIEAATIGAVSWLLATVVLAVPTTLAFGTLFGNLLLDTPLAFTINAWTVAGWLALATLICVLASLVPARRAARMTVSCALVYE